MDKAQLLELALQKLGMTEQDLLADKLKHRIVELAKNRHTIKEMLEISEKEGWLDALYNTRFVDIMPSRPAPSAPKTTYRRVNRLSNAQIAALEAEILDYLEKHPDSGISDIAANVSFDTQKVRTKILSMKAKGMIVGEGSSRYMVYRCAE
jgi:predicted transcriptional regulator